MEAVAMVLTLRCSWAGGMVAQLLPICRTKALYQAVITYAHRLLLLFYHCITGCWLLLGYCGACDGTTGSLDCIPLLLPMRTDGYGILIIMYATVMMPWYAFIQLYAFIT